MKKEYIVLVLVIIALVAYLTLRSTDQANYELPRLEVLENATIDGVQVTSGEEDPIKLVKKDDQWFIDPQGYLADSVTLKNMVSAAAGLTITALVSESGNDQRYELDEDAKINVQVFTDGQKVREFDLGRSAPTFQHTFAKLEGNPNIYHAEGALKNTFDQTIQGLRDKTILSFKKDGINTLEIKKGDHILKATKKKAENQEKEADKTEPPKTQWLDAQDQTVDQNAVDSLVGALADLKCEAYLEDHAKDSLNDPTWTVSLTDESMTYTLHVFGSPDQGDNARVPATSSASKYAFEFPNQQLETIETDVNKLLGIEPEPEKEEQSE